MRKLSISLAAILAVGAVACLDRDLGPIHPCVVSGYTRTVRVNNIDKVDVLFMVDNSGSMSQEQQTLRENFPEMVRVLTTGDIGLDGTIDFPAVRDLHLGVITPDMGIGGFTLGTCDDFDGDDGILQRTGATSVSGCEATYPSFLEFTEGDSPDEIAQAFGCVATLGTGGCGLEQQLEAVLKALTPSTSPIQFLNGSGHGDGANAGFLRPDSLLAVILVTDEEDCSAVDTDLFNRGSTRYSQDMNIRCGLNPDALHPVRRYVDGLLALRRDNPDLLVYAAITGVPTDLVADPDHLDYAAILRDPRMTIAEDTTATTGMPRLVPACVAPEGRGVADPARRIIEVGRMLSEQGAAAVIQSICQSDFTPALRAITRKIADALQGVCLPDALNRNATGRVNCNVVEILPADGSRGTCESLAALGRNPEPIRIEPDGRPVCEVIQVVPDRTTGATSGPGWYYDDFSTQVTSRCEGHPQQIVFTPGAEPMTGVTVRLECRQNAVRDSTEIVVGTPCTPEGDGDGVCATSPVSGLLCDEATRTCQIGCVAESGCPGGLVCAVGMARPICINPTCDL